MELYIHIPFCVRKCNYCDFLSFPCGDLEDALCSDGYKQIERYVDALVGELEGYSGCASSAVSSIFIGGGTPSLLPEALMERVLKAVLKFPVVENCEFTIECNPGTLTKKKLLLYKKYGVNRISLGLQSTDNEELKCLGRIHSFEDFLLSYRLVKETGFSGVNVDLMSGIPGQSAEKFAGELSEVVKLGPEHISAYSLIIEEGTPFYELYGEHEECHAADTGSKKDAGDKSANSLSSGTNSTFKPLPDEDEERLAYHLTQSILASAGYEHYEISNYAKPGFRCVHNLGYWTGVPYLGCGLGAASLIDHVRYKNSDDMEEYIADPVKSRKIEEKLDKESMISEYIILHLRLMDGFLLDEFQELFGISFLDAYRNKVDRFTALKLMSVENGRVFLTDAGIDVSNAVMSEFI